MFKIRGLLFMACLSLAASAQAANPYNGSWTLSFETAADEFEGTVVIKDNAGTWHVDAKSPKSPCVGAEAPIAVKTSTDSELVFEVQRSKSLASCKDWTVSLKKVDEKTLKGEFAGGKEILLQRQ